MKTINLTNAGGLLFNQDHLAFMQSAWKEFLRAFTSMGGEGYGGPVILSGMALDGSSLTPGYFAVDGEVYFTNGGTIVIAPGPGNTLGITLNTVTITENYANGASQEVMYSTTGVFGIVPNSPPADSYTMASFKLFGESFGARHREDWVAITVSTGSGFGSVTGSVRYRKNILTNTLELSGVLTALTPADFPTLPSNTPIVIATLPTGYVPLFNRPFITHISDNTKPLDRTSSQYLLQLSAMVTISGDIGINFVRPVTTATYGLWFCVSIPLD